MVSFEPTRCPNGFNDREPTLEPECLMPVFDPTKHIRYFNDFTDNFLANVTVDDSGDWTDNITQAGAGDATCTVLNVQGGAIRLTCDAADNDNFFRQLKGEPFKFVVGKKTWFKFRFNVSDITQSDFVMGLQITDTTPLAVSDGVYFRKDDGDSDLDCVVIKDGTATTATVSSLLANSTYVVVNFYYNGQDKVNFYVNGRRIASLAVTNLPDDEELTVSYGIQNGEAVAKTMDIDYVDVLQER